MIEKSWKDSGLPPYGVMPTLAGASNDPPTDWGRGGKEFAAWRSEQIEFIGQTLWPLCDVAGQRWTGKAADNMVALTVADLRILEAMRKAAPTRPIDQLPSSPLRHLGMVSHKLFFDQEDDAASGKVEDIRRMYDRKSDKQLFLDPIVELMRVGRTRKAPPGFIYFFKGRLQRPRPYQAAMLLKNPSAAGAETAFAFNHEAAKTAVHPSMISGHAIQGLAGLMGVAERFELDAIAVDADQWAWIYQLAVDFGDRRVLAGVHYPSDNLASWILALRLCAHTVPLPVAEAVQHHVARAIERSIVYRAIVDLPSAERQPYEPALAELFRLMA